MPEPNKFLRAALFYAKRMHWPVIPIRPHAKNPITPHGCLDATLDEAQIRKWWAQSPGANVGIRTGVRFWVLDIDPAKGGDESRDALEFQHGKLADTLRQQTGGGGWHYLYELPDEAHIGCPKTPWDGIDVRGEGGLIVVEPSIHPSGGKYVWDTAKRSILEESINPADGWLIEALLETQPNGRQGRGFQPLPEKIPYGKQHQTLVSEAGKLRDMGMGYDEIVAVLWETNNQRCERPGPRKNIEQIARSALKWEPKHPVAGGSTEPKAPPQERPIVLPEPLSVDDILDLDIPLPQMLVEGLLPQAGLVLMIGAQRSGKTIFAAQMAIALATDKPLLDYYQLRAHGPVIVFEKDDPGGTASFKDIYLRARVPRGTPVHYYPKEKIPVPLGEAFYEWIERDVRRFGARLVVLDSYTALRPQRNGAGDIAKVENSEGSQLDGLAKRLGCAILLLHHESITTRSNSSLEWDACGAGSYGLPAASECQIRITRYRELAIDSRERLVRFRGRHFKEQQVTLRFNAETSLFEFVLDGGAAPLYHIIHEIKRSIRTPDFTAKDLEEPLGISRPTAFRYLAALVSAGAVWRAAHQDGHYRLSPEMERIMISAS